MAVLSDQDRFDDWADLMRECDRLGLSIPVLKTDLRAAYNAADDWVSANAASYNTALPQPFRGAASTGLKALLIMFVTRKRYLKGL